MLRFGLVLAIVMVIYWFSLSGYFDHPLLLVLGAISVLLVLGLCQRMKILDEETAPYLNLPKTLTYFVWLFKEIVKANVHVMRAVLSPGLEVSPKMVKIKSSPATEIGKTMFANSITLTPGTVSVEMSEKEILVHALLTEMSDPEGFEEMADRSAWAIGELAENRQAKGS
ncbi:MAG: Na+/H+ antiporter subunit E [Hellea sp.]|nr:Na+/H+ antiporter subunit E [Hellea sp.]